MSETGIHIKNTNKKVLSNSVIYSLSGLLHKCFNFFLLPLYTAYLTTADYGITNIASSFLNTMSFIVSLSLYSAVMRFYVDLKDNPEKLKRFYGTVVTFIFISNCVFLCLFFIGRELLVKFVFQGASFFPTVLICLLSLFFFCLHAVYENILRSQQKAIKCSILSIAYFLVTVICNVIFVVYCRMGANGVLLSILVATFLYTCFFVIDMFSKKAITLCIDGKLLKEALRYSVPILPHNLSTIIVDLISKLLIGGTTSMGMVGIYSIAAQFGSISDTLQNYVNQAYTPWLFEQLKFRNAEFKNSIRHIVQMLCSVLGLMFIGIGLFSQDYVFLFLNKSYSYAWHYIPLVVMVYSIKILYYFYVSTLFYYKQAAKRLFIATLSGSLINVLLSAFAIPRWGAYGSIAADAIAMAIRVAIVYYMSIKCEQIGLHLSDFIKKVLLIVLFMIVGLLPSYIYQIETFTIYNFVYKLLIAFVYLMILSVTYKKELKRMLKIFKRSKKPIE